MRQTQKHACLQLLARLQSTTVNIIQDDIELLNERQAHRDYKNHERKSPLR